MISKELVSKYNAQMIKALEEYAKSKYPLSTNDGNIYFAKYKLNHASHDIYFSMVREAPVPSMCLYSVLYNRGTAEYSNDLLVDSLLEFNHKLYIGNIVEFEGELRFMLVVLGEDMIDNQEYYLNRKGVGEMLEAYLEQLGYIDEYIEELTNNTISEEEVPLLKQMRQ